MYFCQDDANEDICVQNGFVGYSKQFVLFESYPYNWK